ncbi:MAG: hypothetical protein AB1Z98_06290 [Nannocystaceae bacterium]
MMNIKTPSIALLLTAVALSSLACDAEDPSELGPDLLVEEDTDAQEIDEMLLVEPAEQSTYLGASERTPAGIGLTADIDPQGFVFKPFISEEDPATTCDTGQVMTGFQCSGGNCDSLRIECHGYGGTLGTSTWSTWFSEEGTSWRFCPSTAYVTGMTCQGSQCDDISIECTTSNLARNNCQWSGWFSEEDPAFLANVGDAIAGVQCRGSRCDDKRFFVCET